MDAEFLALAMATRSARDQIEAGAVGVSHSMQNIGQGVIANLWISLPPLPQQLALIARVKSRVHELDGAVERTQRDRPPKRVPPGWLLTSSLAKWTFAESRRRYLSSICLIAEALRQPSRMVTLQRLTMSSTEARTLRATERGELRDADRPADG